MLRVGNGQPPLPPPEAAMPPEEQMPMEKMAPKKEGHPELIAQAIDLMEQAIELLLQCYPQEKNIEDMLPGEEEPEGGSTEA